MKELILFLCVVAGLPATTPSLETLDAPGGGPIRLEVDAGERVSAISDYWRIEFDLRSGGVLDSIVFPAGSGKNLLLSPFVSYVDQWSDENAPATGFTHVQKGSVVRLEFSGRMAAAGRHPGPIEYRTTWTISPFFVRADHTLRLSEDVAASAVGIASTAVRADLNEFAVRSGPMVDDAAWQQRINTRYGTIGRAGTKLVDDRHAPVYLLLFDRGVEGFDLSTASDLATWERALAGRAGAGRFAASVSDDGSRIRVVREPLRSEHPVRLKKGEYTFSYYLGLPRIVEKSNRKWRHLSFGNHPWPSDREVARWAENGVNIVRLHNDYSEDENFWHDGAWPPYDEKGMTEMKRVIAACRRHGIKVVPYFSIHELHPKAQGFTEHSREWARTVDELGTVIHSLVGKGEYGAIMCPTSAWLERRKRDIEQAYRELKFDGIYYDQVVNIGCTNTKHGTDLHFGVDGVVELLAWTRRLIAPDGPLILHLGGNRHTIIFENFADLVVNMEELSGAESSLQLEDLPLLTLLAESLPRSPCPSYREDRSLERNRQNISILTVFGMFPWAASGLGEVYSELYEETLKLFRAFKPYRLEQYKLHDALAGVVKTSWEGVYGAAYSSPERAIVVVSNTSPEKRKNVVWRVKAKDLGFEPTPKLTVKDVRTGQTRQVATAALSDGSFLTELDGYEYRLFEISPAR